MACLMKCVTVDILELLPAVFCLWSSSSAAAGGGGALEGRGSVNKEICWLPGNVATEEQDLD